MNLLFSRRFFPLFLTQFLGAFNDNLYKNALVILVTYVIAEKAQMNAQLMVTLAAGLFILPFFLFSAIAGKIADKYEKSRLIQRIKLAEIVLMLFAALGLYLGNLWMLMAVLFLLGVQAAFFGPLKYSILPDHLAEKELITANGYIEAGTFLAILLGTILGGLLILAEGGVGTVSLLVLLMALAGWAVSFKIPVATAADPDLRISPNIFRATWEVIAESRERSDVFLSIIGISWFWFIGATFLSQFPSFAKEILHADETVVTLFLSVFSVGIGIGSLLCNRLLKGKVTGSYAAPAALAMAAFTLMLYLMSLGYEPELAAHIAQKTPEFFEQNSFPFALPDEMMGMMEFLLMTPFSMGILASLLLIAISGGIYIVPLYAIMQVRSDKRECAQVVAANNILNALFMVLSALLTLALLAMEWKVTDVFLLTGLINLPISYLVHKIVVIEQAKRKGATDA
jgi:acyl-[acyl-carrier-protein]-phospholipid O-acyltransferase / long-chain-fatty-acid--[acyl-carrier-protein] ligase